MVRNDADDLCMDCSMGFADRLLPVDVRFWDEPEAPSAAISDGFGDSVYGEGISGATPSLDGSESTRATVSAMDPVTAGTGGCDWDSEFPHAIMYEKIAEVWHLEQKALPLEEPPRA